jgi:protein TonB
MTQAGFYQHKRMRPGTLAMVVLLHGAAITALAVAKEGGFRHIKPPATMIDFIKDKEDPKPKPKPPEPHPLQPEVLTWVPPLIDVPKRDPVQTPPMPYPIPRLDPLPGPTLTDPPPTPAPPPPPPPPVSVEPARAKANLASYVSDADYPSEAIRREEQGTTRFRLAVGPDGRVQDCRITASSGSTALDSATCRLMKSRARFTPAHDTSGNAVVDTVSNAITWRLPSS